MTGRSLAKNFAFIALGVSLHGLGVGFLTEDFGVATDVAKRDTITILNAGQKLVNTGVNAGQRLFNTGVNAAKHELNH